MKNANRRVNLQVLRRLTLGGMAMCAAAVQPAAFGQETQGRTLSGDSVEEVIVTATRRSEELKNVPQAISVLDDRLLSNINSDSLESFAAFVPGLEMQAFSPGRTRITMRGVSPDEQTGVTTISYYLDEIPLTSPEQRSQPEVRLYDIDHVEVLRGPQGTLYGEGAMGGTLRIITNKPDASQFAGSARVNSYSIERGDVGYTLDGMVNVPLLKDVLALRVVAENRYDAGWIDQDVLSIPDPSIGPPGRYVVAATEKDANHSRDTSVRAALRFTPTADFTLDLTYITDDLDVHTANIATVDAYHHRDLALRPNTSRSDLWNLTGTYAFENFSVTSASSYATRDTTRSEPQEPLLLGSTLANSYAVAQTSDGDLFTQEVRVLSDSEQRFRWTVGGYYREASGTDTVLSSAASPLPDSSVTITDMIVESDFETYAFFGEAEYDITDALTFIAGARWFHESEDGTTYFGGQLFNELERESEDTTSKATLRYRFEDNLMAYVTYAEGYRPGGFNRFSGPMQYEPDTTRNYELGAKYTSPGGHFSISGAAYYIEWANMQFIQLDDGGFFTFVGNANKASSRGIEAEIDYRSDNGWWTRLSGNITDAHLDADVFGNFTGIIPSGRELPSVPPYKVSAIFGYDVPVFAGDTLSLTAGVSFVGEQDTKLEENGTYNDPLFGGAYVIGSTISSYSIGTLRAQLTHDKWTAALYVNNVWNERTPLGNDNFLPTFGQPLYYLQPRTVGLELSLRL